VAHDTCARRGDRLRVLEELELRPDIGDILEWPEHWQRANGVRPEDLAARGAAHTIAEVLGSPPDRELRATIHARVVDLAGGADWARVRVDDGTGRLDVLCPPGTTLLGPRLHATYELDIVVAPTSAAGLRATTSPRCSSPATEGRRARPPQPCGGSSRKRPAVTKLLQSPRSR